jgi:cell division septal protein FtsQ
MTKKQLKAWLIEQIRAAILNVSGDYSVTEQGDYVFILPEVGTKFAIRCAVDPNEYKNSRLREFSEKISKSKAFTNVKGCPHL